MIVVSDTTPLNYLVLVSKQDILPLLFGRVIVPEAVMRELQAAAAPPEVRQWLSSRPAWLETKQAATPPDTTLSHLDEGEREAIQLAKELEADLLIIDERTRRGIEASFARDWHAGSPGGRRRARVTGFRARSGRVESA